MKIPKPLVFELLNKSHDRSGFSCGRKSLHDYLVTRSGQELRQNIAFPYVMTFEGENRVLGYYTLSATSIPLYALPRNIAKVTRYEVVPAILIGRLALDMTMQGQGTGKLLLVDALRRIARSSDFAILVVVVDPKDEEAIRFYERFGFASLHGMDGRMFLPFKTIKGL